MSDTPGGRTAFLTLVGTVDQKSRARLLIESIRSFGGPLCRAPIWLFEADPQRVPCEDLGSLDVRVHPLAVPDTVRHHWFASKVYACAQAEVLATPEIRSLVWLSPDVLVIRPPTLFDLAPSSDIAVRPVHIRNIGLPITEPVDDFWQHVYQIVGVRDVTLTVESFIGAERIRAYFNSHAFAVNPAQGLLRRWFECFATLAGDRQFQSGPCADELHRIFLHQAILSTLIATSLDPGRIRSLPPEYSYPYNLQQRIAPDQRAATLNNLVCIAYEDRPLDPALVDDIGIDEPLRSWLSARVSRAGQTLSPAGK